VAENFHVQMKIRQLTVAFERKPPFSISDENGGYNAIYGLAAAIGGCRRAN